MQALTEAQIRASFVNGSKSVVAKATVPDLDSLDWERLDLLGWRDPKLEQTSYLVVEVDGQPRGVILRRGTEPTVKRRKMCTLCEDIVDVDDVGMYVAALAGPAGRRGDTIGTFVCGDFRCSARVRRPPTMEAGGVDETSRAAIIERRVDGLRTRAARFVKQVLGEA